MVEKVPDGLVALEGVHSAEELKGVCIHCDEVKKAALLAFKPLVDEVVMPVVRAVFQAGAIDVERGVVVKGFDRDCLIVSLTVRDARFLDELNADFARMAAAGFTENMAGSRGNELSFRVLFVRLNRAETPGGAEIGKVSSSVRLGVGVDYVLPYELGEVGH